MKTPDRDALGRTVILGKAGRPTALRVRKYKLLMVSGANQGREVVSDREVFAIGASRDCDLVVDDTAVSRRHCEIHATAEGFLIRDLASTNGTTMHGVRVCEAYLEQGAEFQVGNTRLIFCPLAESVEHPLSRRESFGRLLGQSVAMRRLFHQAERFAATEAPLLIEGETGTGKELLADAIHHHSPRRAGPYVVIDCGALAPGLVESELFGHVRGAFTGAAGDRKGAFELAAGGTVFLDEIAECPLDLQPRLLRVLEKKEVRRLGSNHTRPADVRVLAATNRRLEAEVKAGRFREDLYYRLAAARLEIPPLRQRLDDLALLTRHILAEFAGGALPVPAADLERALALFARYPWPGNVRELRNVIQIAAQARPGTLDLSACLALSRVQDAAGSAPGAPGGEAAPYKVVKGRLVDRFEREYVAALLARHDGNVSHAARTAEIERAYLQRLIRKHGLKA